MYARPLAVSAAITVLLALALAPPCPAAEAADTRRFQIQVGFKYGFIDAAGNEVIPPCFDGTRAFSEGLGAVRVDGLWGYVDPSGAFVIEPRFAEAFGFSEGLAYVETKDGNGFIDRTGRLAIDLGETRSISSFSDGFAVVDDGDSGYTYIDRTGRRPIKRSFVYAYGFSCGRAVVAFVSRRGSTLWGHIDTKGRFIRPPSVERCSSFFGPYAVPGAKGRTRCLAFVSVNGRWGCIDASGRVVIRPRYEYGLETGPEFSEGLAIVQVHDGPVYIDPSGRVAVHPPSGQPGYFSEGLAWFADLETSKMGYLDTTGAVVVTPQFDEAWSFEDGLAEARVGSVRGYIDRHGRFVWKTTPRDPTTAFRTY